MILDGLCRHWGFYFVANKGPSGIGSQDFLAAMDMDNAMGYKLAQTKKMVNREAMRHMKEKAHHRLRQLLLARFILLKMFVDAAQKVTGGLNKNHQRAWVILQILPVETFGVDIFEELTKTLQYEDFDDLKEDIKNHYTELNHILGSAIDPAIGKKKKTPFYCVLDECQLLASERMGEFVSDDGVSERPLMREVYLVWARILPPQHMLLICSGTGINYQSFYMSLSSGTLLIPYLLQNYIGAFENRDAQTKYIQYYLGDRNEPSWRAFLKRAWGWCRGRYLFESSRRFLSLITLSPGIAVRRPSSASYLSAAIDPPTPSSINMSRRLRNLSRLMDKTGSRMSLHLL